MKKIIAIIEPSALCNLCCPSCPMGNMKRHTFKNRHMSPEKFEEIMIKLKKETTESCYTELVVWLYNWCEPLLNPGIDELIKIAKRYSDWVGVSSNLSIKNKTLLKHVLLSGPHAFKVSVSGFSDDIYTLGHKNGKIKIVKDNIAFCACIIHGKNLIKKFFIGYHMYNDNLESELTNMMNYCKNLGFIIEPYIAYVSPIEKTIAYLTNEADTVLNSVIDRLLITPRQIHEILEKEVDLDGYCYWLEEMIVIDVDGKVDLCCRTFDQKLDLDFLDTSWEKIMSIKKSHPFCDKCKAHYLHKLDHPRVTDFINKTCTEYHGKYK